MAIIPGTTALGIRMDMGSGSGTTADLVADTGVGIEDDFGGRRHPEGTPVTIPSRKIWDIGAG
ncbi:hypothetical protein [Granulicella aggregans]|nr:hypothetical protein [Granulicella aggregans]